MTLTIVYNDNSASSVCSRMKWLKSFIRSRILIAGKWYILFKTIPKTWLSLLLYQYWFFDYRVSIFQRWWNWSSKTDLKSTKSKFKQASGISIRVLFQLKSKKGDNSQFSLFFLCWEKDAISGFVYLSQLNPLNGMWAFSYFREKKVNRTGGLVNCTYW